MTFNNGIYSKQLFKSNLIYPSNRKERETGFDKVKKGTKERKRERERDRVG